MTTDLKHLNIYIGTDEAQGLRLLASDEGRTLSAYCRRVLAAHLAEALEQLRAKEGATA